MKKILAICLAAVLLLALCACAGQKPTAPTTTTPTSGTTINPTTTNPTTKPTGIAEEEAKQIASELLGKYIWYGAVGACCDMEYVEGDMSAYLSDAQKDIYVGSQQRITCCKNEEEVIAHLHQTFSDRLITSYPEDLLFTDGSGNLYIIIYPMGLPYFKDHRVVSFSESFITLEADCYEEGTKEGTARVVCARTFDGFILEEYEYTPAR